MQAAPSTLEQVLLEHALAQVLTRYASCCDQRNWHLLPDIFAPDCTTIYGGGWRCEGIEQVQQMLAQHLTGCGPTQHLLGNLEVDASAPTQVRSKIHVRAIHKGLGERSALRYDAVGFYEDQWVRLPQGWRIQHRRMTMLLDMGDFSVLQPEKTLL